MGGEGVRIQIGPRLNSLAMPLCVCSMECHCQAPKAGSGRGALLFSPSRFKASSIFYLIHRRQVKRGRQQEDRWEMYFFHLVLLDMGNV